jgi:CHASE2 domain-containing sensor protein
MEQWFDQRTAGIVGAIIGSSLGIAGGVIGSLCGFCVRRGWKKLLYSLFIFMIIVCLGLFVTGLVALISKQPYHVWYPFMLSGIGLVVFGSLFPVVRRRFTENELRQMQAKDL